MELLSFLRLSSKNRGLNNFSFLACEIGRQNILTLKFMVARSCVRILKNTLVRMKNEQKKNSQWERT